MQTDERNLCPIWMDEPSKKIKVIDQRRLPHTVAVIDLDTVDDVIRAIAEMVVRGAPLIGITGAWGVYLATVRTQQETCDDAALTAECRRNKAARPTAVNLAWAVDRMLSAVIARDRGAERIRAAAGEAAAITDAEAECCRKIGEHGLTLIERIALKKPGRTVNILTHCNAGWLATIAHGTATAPMYAAFDSGLDIHVWVDETRPLNQGARLTAWELGRHGIRHTVITDNAGGHLMQHGEVDLVIVGTDRTTHTGDVANKIGTYLKALAARDNGIPFYVALPSSTFDWTLTDGVRQIPIETRNPDEIRYVQGRRGSETLSVLVPPEDSPAGNYAFDVTPARLVTGFITERGICRANEADIRRLFPEKAVDRTATDSHR